VQQGGGGGVLRRRRCVLLVAHGPGDLLHLHVYPGPLSGAHLNDDASQGPNVGVFPDPFRKGLRFKGLGRHVVPGARDARAAVDGGLQDQGDAKVGKDGMFGGLMSRNTSPISCSSCKVRLRLSAY